MTLDDNVYQVGLAYLVDEDKQASYIGREALQRVKAQGVTRTLAGVEIDGDPIEMNAVRWNVTKEGAAAGCVTSAAWSPRLERNIGYAMLPVAHSALGTTLSVDIPGAGERRATVVVKPFVDPQKAVPKN
jgi:aminomethyltransferase